MNDDLIRWLLECVAEDEATLAHPAVPGSASVALGGQPATRYWSQRQAKVDCVSKRRMINMLRKQDECLCDSWGHHADTGEMLRVLAAPYSERPGFRSDWVPAEPDTP